jgi:hypothetical protein
VDGCRQLQPDALGDHPFLAAGRDKQQVFLPVVVEAKILRVAGKRRHRHRRRRGVRAVCRRRAGPGDKGAHPVLGVGRHPPAQPQPVDQLAVVDREAAKRRFRHPGLAAIVGDVAQQRFAHETISEVTKNTHKA